MTKGQIDLYYNYELDELFLIKKGCIFGKFMIESYDGTSKPYKKFEDLESSSNLLENAVKICEV